MIVFILVVFVIFVMLRNARGSGGRMVRRGAARWCSSLARDRLAAAHGAAARQGDPGAAEAASPEGAVPPAEAAHPEDGDMLNEDEHRRIGRAIREAETQTSADIVCVVARQSSTTAPFPSFGGPSSRSSCPGRSRCSRRGAPCASWGSRPRSSS